MDRRHVGRGKATKDGKGWHVEFSDDFLAEVDRASPEVRQEVLDLINGLADGSIDPTKMGSRYCEYCNAKNDDAPMGVNACEKCLDELR